MSREFKFRAWYADMNQMVGWEYLQTELGHYKDPFVESEFWKPMQFTGLRDKNGVEIYEGDVVGMFGRSQLSEVHWSDETGGWMVWAQDSRASPLAEGFLANYLSTCEVIGNIYENPDLLKEVE